MKERLFGLDVNELLENTASDKLHIWFPKAEQKGTQTLITNYATDDAELAATTYTNARASLYFGSSLDFRNSYCKALSHQMGFDFSGYFPGTSSDTSLGDSQAEIEIFMSRKGNFTDFHMDF